MEINTTQDNSKLIMKLNLFFDRNFNILMFVILALVFILGLLFVIYPKYKSVSDRNKQTVYIKNSEYNKVKQYHQKLNNILLNYNKISEADKEKLKLAIPEKPGIEDLFVFWEDLARSRGLVLKTLQIKDLKSEKSPKKTKSRRSTKTKQSVFDNIGKIEISVALDGIDYTELKKLLSIIEKNSRIMDVNSVDFNLDSGSLSIKLTTYYYEYSR